MSQELVIKNLEKSLRTKSLTDLLRVKTGNLIVLLIDVSGSMGDRMRNGKSKVSGLQETVKDIQQKRPVRMFAFGGDGAYETTSIPHPSGGTPLHKAIDLARSKEVSHCIVISDGEPDDPPNAMAAARNFGGQIDVVYVGDPGGGGESFLKELSNATGGTSFTGDLSQPKELSRGIMGLLGAASGEEDDD